MAHAIAGGIESPIQFILQLWLILNGKIGKPWEMTGYLNHLDWQGNAIYFPTTALISLIFSVLSMVKAAVEFNIIGVHIRVWRICFNQTASFLLVHWGVS